MARKRTSSRAKNPGPAKRPRGGQGGESQLRTPSPPRVIGPQSLMPQVPPNSNPLTIENNLHLVPNSQIDFTRPWFICDWVDPAPKFRRMGDDYDWDNPDECVSMGEDQSALADIREEGTKPVFVYGYYQQFMISVPNESTYETLFDYGKDELCDITVWPVIHGTDVDKKVVSITKPKPDQLLPKRTYKVHAGYIRPLTGFLREIDLVYAGIITDQDSLFRASYLLQVLDYFAEELRGLEVPKGTESHWRSRALNPLLQRQLRGVYDQDATRIRKDVGEAREGAAKYYLSCDPLDPKEAFKMLRGILYVWPVRWSLITRRRRSSEDAYRVAHENTKRLLRRRGVVDDKDWEAVPLCDYEYQLILAERAEEYYKNLIEEGMLRGSIQSPEVGAVGAGDNERFQEVTT